MSPERACWRPNTCTFGWGWSQLPNDPQETEAFLRFFTGALLRLVDRTILENKVVKSIECLSFFGCLINQGRLLNGANPWEYLVAIQEYQKDVWKNPALWVPWSYETRLKELQEE